MDDETTTPPRFLIVGIDGSDASISALRWAIRQAALTGGDLQVALAWNEPTMTYGSRLGVQADLRIERAGREYLESIIADIASDNPAVKVTARLLEEPPALKLVEAAEGAELLVVGSRGHGAFTGMLIGSTSQYCVAHATCPVVVVRGEQQS